MTEKLHGVIARFDEADALERAVRATKAAGYTRLDAFSPFPLRELARELGARPTALSWIALTTGLIGAAVQYATQYGLNVLDYPLNVGGRPLHSWPAFIPATLIVAILWTGTATLLGMLLLLRLPRLDHPLFAVPGFERASEDRFFLLILAEDPRFDREEAAAFLRTLGAPAVREVPA
jgi:hypothetical protein